MLSGDIEIKTNNIEEKVSIERLKFFFKKAAEEAAKNEPGNIQSTDFFESNKTPEDQSLHDRWIAYVENFRKIAQLNNEVPDNNFFKFNDIPLLIQEYNKWFLGAENNFKAAKIFKKCYDEYDFCLTSALPENKNPAHGKIYFEKTKNNKLFYCVIKDDINIPVEGKLNILVEGDLTIAFLESKKSEILKSLFINQHALFGQQAFDLYLTLKPQERNIIPRVVITGKDLCITGFENYKYYLSKLDSRHPRAAVLGKLTKCCQSLLNLDGQPRTIHGIEKVDGGFYVICKMKGQTPDLVNDPIVAQTWAWRANHGVNYNLVLDAIVILAQEGMGQVRGKTCRNVDVWIAFYQQLARTLVETYKFFKVTARLDELKIQNIGGIIGNNLLAAIPYPYGYSPYKDPSDTYSFFQKYNHQTILAINDIPLYALYMLSNDRFRLTQSDKEKLEVTLCDYFNSTAGLAKIKELITHLTINSKLIDKIEYLRILDMISVKLIQPNQEEMKRVIHSFINLNTIDVFNNAFHSTRFFDWWFQKANVFMTMEGALTVALFETAKSGNMAIFNQLRIFSQFTKVCKIERVEKEQIYLGGFNDPADYEYPLFSPLTKAIKYGNLEIAQGLIEDKIIVKKQDIKIAFKYFNFHLNEKTWNILHFLLEETQKQNIKLEKEQLYTLLKSHERLTDKILSEKISKYLQNKLITAFRKIYRALHDSQSKFGIVKSDFLKDKKEHFHTNEIINYIQKNQCDRGAAKAWELSQFHFINCNENNMELFEKIYQWSFEQRFFSKSRLFGSWCNAIFNKKTLINKFKNADDLKLNVQSYAENHPNTRTGIIINTLK